MKGTEMTKFVTRLPAEQKVYFEQAANLGGYKTLAEFVIFSVKAQADKIFEKQNSILASQKDQEIFFAAIMNPEKTNKKLKDAATRYKKLTVGQ